MQITAGMVKELRERTGAGMMECKKALVEADGSIDVAIEQMRIVGLAKADKKSVRIAVEGAISIRVADDQKTVAMVEVNCETDFVSKGGDFAIFADAVAKRVLSDNPADNESLAELPLIDNDAQTVNTARQELVAKIGENIQVRRFVRRATPDGVVGSYLHSGRIGVFVCLTKDDPRLAKDIAMHVAASHPRYIDQNGVPPELLKKEKTILIAEARESGKPSNVIDKIVEGRIKKYLSEITLVGQPFIKDPDMTVAQLLASANAKVTFFSRYEVGEGIEKSEKNFADEVMAQVQGNQ